MVDERASRSIASREPSSAKVYVYTDVAETAERNKQSVSKRGHRVSKRIENHSVGKEILLLRWLCERNLFLSALERGRWTWWTNSSILIRSLLRRLFFFFFFFLIDSNCYRGWNSTMKLSLLRAHVRSGINFIDIWRITRITRNFLLKDRGETDALESQRIPGYR